MEVDSPEEDFQRASSTKRFKSPGGYGTLTNGILKKVSSNPDIAGLSLTDGKKSVKSTSAAKADGYISPNSKGYMSRTNTSSPKVQFNEAELDAIAKSRKKEKLKRNPFRKSLKRSAQSCPDLAALAEEMETGESMLLEQDSNYGRNELGIKKEIDTGSTDRKMLKPRRNLAVPRVKGDQSDKIPVFDPKKLNKTVSCPDFLNAYDGFYSEDERKNRRLARNRASARLRRQRKRLMIDILEAKVRKLETRLAKIKKLKWTDGGDSDGEGLNKSSVPFRDLGVDLNHPDVLDVKARNDRINEILRGIRANIDVVCGDALRASVLGWLGADVETSKQTLTAMGCGNNLGGIDALRADLIKVLDLSQEQLQKLNLIEKQCASSHEFSFSVFLKQCLFLFAQQRLYEHNLLDTAIESFNQVCQDAQKKKFLTWSGQNVVAISGLSLCGPKVKDVDKHLTLKTLKLQTNCSHIDGDEFENLPSGQYYPRADETSNLPVFFFGGRDSVY